MNDIVDSDAVYASTSRQNQKRMHRRKKTAAHDERRQEIIERCATLFDRVGFHGTSMQLLADEVGISKPTLYHYFRSKNDMLYEMHQMHIAAMGEGLEDFEDTSGNVVEVLQRACVNILREIAEHPGCVRAFMNHYTELVGEQRAEVRKTRAAYFQRISNTIKKGIEFGTFRNKDPELISLAFLGMCNWAYKWYPKMLKELPPEEAAKGLIDLFLGGLCQPETRSAKAD
jgi:AcrR family transcriptional regulator